MKKHKDKDKPEEQAYEHTLEAQWTTTDIQTSPDPYSNDTDGPEPIDASAPKKYKTQH